MLGGYLAFKLARASGVEVRDIGHSLSYVIGYETKPPIFTRYAYAALTIIPLLTLQNRVINLMGALVGLCFLYSYFVMRDVWFSVWCLEAAMFSMLVFFSIRPTKIFMASVAAIYVRVQEFLLRGHFSVGLVSLGQREGKSRPL